MNICTLMVALKQYKYMLLQVCFYTGTIRIMLHIFTLENCNKKIQNIQNTILLLSRSCQNIKSLFILELRLLIRNNVEQIHVHVRVKKLPFIDKNSNNITLFCVIFLWNNHQLLNTRMHIIPYFTQLVYI